mmetsp:Transcript_49323/g.127220  ORF Transcript_49323/g.127220 Transcript_49323/m.127220 type:complete len:220 (+) Transcript_49323:499-1158(+)
MRRRRAAGERERLPYAAAGPWRHPPGRARQVQHPPRRARARTPGAGAGAGGPDRHPSGRRALRLRDDREHAGLHGGEHVVVRHAHGPGARPPRRGRRGLRRGRPAAGRLGLDLPDAGAGARQGAAASAPGQRRPGPRIRRGGLRGGPVAGGGALSEVQLEDRGEGLPCLPDHHARGGVSDQAGPGRAARADLRELDEAADLLGRGHPGLAAVSGGHVPR